MEGKIKDIKMAEAGHLKIEWAEAHMPVMMALREKYSKTKPLTGMRISGCLHVTKETAVLVRTLIAAGAQVAWSGCNPLSTQDDVAAALYEEDVPIWAWHGMSTEEFYWCIDQTLVQKPTLTLDDGADLISTIHKLRYGIRTRELDYLKDIVDGMDFEELVNGIVGGSEETTTGVIRLKALAREKKLLYPVIAVNDAESKRLFDNPIGTGQSALDGIIRATNTLLAGRDAVVVGFGNVGSGIARRLRGMGARVTVVEVDPIKALKAVMDGFNVEPMSRAARHGDLFITATGDINVIRREHFEVMRDGAILANAGHFNVEINLRDLEEISVRKERVSDCITRYVLRDGRRLHLLAGGRLVNLACAEGHPSEVMDMSFSLQALSARYLVENRGKLPRAVLMVPVEIDREVASLKLRAMGIEIERLTDEQRKYLSSWTLGT